MRFWIFGPAMMLGDAGDEMGVAKNINAACDTLSVDGVMPVASKNGSSLRRHCGD
jgi:hypothetical protein